MPRGCWETSKLQWLFWFPGHPVSDININKLFCQKPAYVNTLFTWNPWIKKILLIICMHRQGAAHTIKHTWYIARCVLRCDVSELIATFKLSSLGVLTSKNITAAAAVCRVSSSFFGVNWNIGAISVTIRPSSNLLLHCNWYAYGAIVQLTLYFFLTVVTVALTGFLINKLQRVILLNIDTRISGH